MRENDTHDGRSVQVTGNPTVRFTSRGSVLEVPVRITVNQHANTMDGLIGRRSFLHMGMLNNLKSEVEQVLKGLDALLYKVSHLGCNHALVGGSEEAEYEQNVRAFVDSARATCKSLMDKHSLETTDAFNDDAQFSKLVTEGVSMKQLALRGDTKYVLLDAWLQTACAAGSFEMYQALMQAGAKASAQDTAGRTPLLAACEGGSLEICEALIKAGVDASVQDERGRTPLLAACERGSFEICEALIEAGAGVSVQDKRGRTPLLAACERGSSEIYEALIKAGADASAKDSMGKTLLLAACEGGSFAIFEALIKGGADNSVQDKGEQMMAACKTGSLEIYEALVATGADTQVAYDGATALGLSVVSGNWKLVEFVLRQRSNALDSSDPTLIVVASDLVQLASVYVQAFGIDAQLRNGVSPLALRGEMGALLSALETSKDDITGAGHAAALKVQLGNVRAFVDHHGEILQQPPVPLAHTLMQLATQEADVVFGGDYATMPAAQAANQPPMIHWVNKPQTTRPCRWTLRAGHEVSGVAYSPDGARLALAAGSAVVICDTATGFEVCRLRGHLSK